MRPRTLLALARRRRVTLPANDEAGLREWFRFRDFDHFVEIYLTCSKCVRDPEDFGLTSRQDGCTVGVPYSIERGSGVR